MVVSFANKIALVTSRQFGRSFVYIMNKSVPRTEPCGTPHGNVFREVFVLLYNYLTYCVLSVR